jgi:hypothetical protein
LRQINFFLILMAISASAAGVVPVNDNILFAFEKCKELSVNLEKGQLRESLNSSFDLHCRKKDKLEFQCSYFDTGSSKKLNEETFTGGSDLGVGEFKNKSGSRIKFLIGKNFASYESGKELKACAGIFIFEKDALKRKASSPVSD